jgi:xanthine dehydrogenase iron-sulfur cluster and FAD-binding subunit A
MRRAGEIAAGEITPWTDVRGSEEYRRRLAVNVLSKFFHDVAGPQPPPFEPPARDPRSTFDISLAAPGA